MKRIVFAFILAVALAVPVGFAGAQTATVDKYVSGLVSDRNGDTHGQAEKYAVVGSLAAEYAKHYQAIRSQVGSALGTTNKTKIKGGYRLCDEKKENCSTLTAFRTQKGKVSTFRSHGQPLDQAFRQLGQPATDSPLTVRARSAYVSSNGIMQVLVDIRNDGDRPLLPQGYSSAWIDASGRQHMNQLADVAEAAPEINSQATGTMLLAFDNPDGQIGGRAHIEVFDNHPAPSEPQAHYDADLPIG